MNVKKISIAVTAVFAAVCIVFSALTVFNLVKTPEQAPVSVQTVIQNRAESYKVSGNIVYNEAEQTLDSVISNSSKKTQFPEGMLEELKNAYAANNDCVGRVYIPGTELDSVIVQSATNSGYIKTDFYKTATTNTTVYNYGNIFLDYRCNSTDLSKNTILFGHTTGKATGIPQQSFRSLYEYKDMQHFIENPIIKYKTLYKEYTFKICAVFYATTQAQHDNGYVFNYIYPAMSDNNMVGYIEQINQRKLYDTGVSLEPTDKILTLSTCIYDFGKSVDTRLVVVGRMLHEGEAETIDATLVKDNPDYRRPQVWYSNQGKANPYKNSEKWVPSPN